MADMMIPEGWKKASLGELCKFSGGSAFKEKYQGKTQGDYPFIKVSDMNLEGNQRFIINANHWIDQNIRLEAKIKLFPASAIVFAKVGAALLLNRRRILIRETAIDNNMMAAIPLEDDNNFLYYILQEIDLGEIVQEGAVPSVNQAQMEEIPVLIPPLPEQQKIATILSSVDTVIEKTRAQIDKLKHLKTGMMQELLTQGIGHTEFKDSPVGRIPKTWKVKTLGELVTIKHGYAFEGEFFSSSPTPYILLTPGNFNRDGRLYFGSKTKYYDGFIPNEYILDNDDVLIVMTDLTKEMTILGNTIILKSDAIVLHNQRIGKVEVLDGKTLEKEYLCFVMNSEHVKSHIKDTATGTTVRHTSPTKILESLVPVPPATEQLEIINIYNSLDSRLSTAENKLLLNMKLKNALMQDLLTGKVSVNI